MLAWMLLAILSPWVLLEPRARTGGHVVHDGARAVQWLGVVAHLEKRKFRLGQLVRVEHCDIRPGCLKLVPVVCAVKVHDCGDGAWQAVQVERRIDEHLIVGRARDRHRMLEHVLEMVGWEGVPFGVHGSRVAAVGHCPHVAPPAAQHLGAAG